MMTLSTDDAVPMPRNLPRPLLDERQAAELLGVSIRTMQAWRLRGGGPAHRKIGRLVKYSPDDVEDYSESCVRTSTSDTGEADAA